jgi:hypothetical protein
MSYLINAPFAGMPEPSSIGKKELHAADGETYVMQVAPQKWEAWFQGVKVDTKATREKARDVVRAKKHEAGIQWGPNYLTITIMFVQPGYAAPFNRMKD